MDEEKKHWVAFSVFPGIGPVRFRLLINYFGSAKAAWDAKRTELLGVGLPLRLVAEFETFRGRFSTDNYMDRLSRLGVTIVTSQNADYPTNLLQISDAPFVLYVRGRVSPDIWNKDRAVGVVGTRQITPYGREVTRRITAGLVDFGCTIISGLAYGVDAVAHETAIRSGGKTIAVLGCGVDVIAPASNAWLYKKIIDGAGLVVSEMPLGLRPGKGLFPARNRIISGLAKAVVVTEGARDSGALITARNAAEQGREVFAVPGPITSPMSGAPTILLKNGAHVAVSADDIVDELGIAGGVRVRGKSTFAPESEAQRKILEIMKKDTVHIDNLIDLTGLTMEAVAATVSILELKGVIKDFGGKVYGIV